MSALTVLICCYLHYGRAWLAPHVWLYRFGAAFCIAAWVAQPIFIAMARNHYTVDMVCGVLITGLVWRLLGHEFGPDPTPWGMLQVKPACTDRSDEAFAQHIERRGEVAGGAALLAVCVGFIVLIAVTFVSLIS